jgi:diketogulonate reductase-like aldo/keto reductase
VESSIKSSLDNFRVNDDMVLIHSPYPKFDQTLQAWEAMEKFVPDKVRQLGFSNVSREQLEALCKVAKVKPMAVQNRFYPDTQYDRELRSFCGPRNIQYQAYWILKKNAGLLYSRPVVLLSEKARVSQQAALFLMVHQLGGIAILDGSSSRDHVYSNIEGLKVANSWIEKSENQEEWLAMRQSFTECMEKELEERHA